MPGSSSRSPACTPVRLASRCSGLSEVSPCCLIEFGSPKAFAKSRPDSVRQTPARTRLSETTPGAGRWRALNLSSTFPRALQCFIARTSLRRAHSCAGFGRLSVARCLTEHYGTWLLLNIRKDQSRRVQERSCVLSCSGVSRKVRSVRTRAGPDRHVDQPLGKEAACESENATGGVSGYCRRSPARWCCSQHCRRRPPTMLSMSAGTSSAIQQGG